MFRILFLAMLTLSFSSWAAGPPDRPPADGEQRFAELVELLSLSEAQQPPVRQALAVHHALMLELGRGERDQRDELNALLAAELQTLLSADQFERWETIQQERRPPPRGERRASRQAGEGRGAARPH